MEHFRSRTRCPFWKLRIILENALQRDQDNPISEARIILYCGSVNFKISSSAFLHSLGKDHGESQSQGYPRGRLEESARRRPRRSGPTPALVGPVQENA